MVGRQFTTLTVNGVFQLHSSSLEKTLDSGKERNRVRSTAPRATEKTTRVERKQIRGAATCVTAPTTRNQAPRAESEPCASQLGR